MKGYTYTYTMFGDMEQNILAEIKAAIKKSIMFKKEKLKDMKDDEVGRDLENFTRTILEKSLGRYEGDVHVHVVHDIDDVDDDHDDHDDVIDDNHDHDDIVDDDGK